MFDVGRMREEGCTFLASSAWPPTTISPLIIRVVHAVRVRGRWAWIPDGGIRAAPVGTLNLRQIIPSQIARNVRGHH